MLLEVPARSLFFWVAHLGAQARKLFSSIAANDPPSHIPLVYSVTHRVWVPQQPTYLYSCNYYWDITLNLHIGIYLFNNCARWVDEDLLNPFHGVQLILILRFGAFASSARFTWHSQTSPVSTVVPLSVRRWDFGAPM